MSNTNQATGNRLLATGQSCIVLAMTICMSYAQADTLTDPTRPANTSAKATTVARGSEPASRLSAIFQSGDRRVAVLDGRVVKAGDRIGEIVIQEILSDSVRYVRAGRVEVARLPKQAAAVRNNRNDTVRNEAARNGSGHKDSIRQESSP